MDLDLLRSSRSLLGNLSVPGLAAVNGRFSPQPAPPRDCRLMLEPGKARTGGSVDRPSLPAPCHFGSENPFCMAPTQLRADRRLAAAQ